MRNILNGCDQPVNFQHGVDVPSHSPDPLKNIEQVSKHVDDMCNLDFFRHSMREPEPIGNDEDEAARDASAPAPYLSERRKGILSDRLQKCKK